MGFVSIKEKSSVQPVQAVPSFLKAQCEVSWGKKCLLQSIKYKTNV